MSAGSTERLETSLERQLNWIAATESRISLIVPLATALFGTIAIKYDTFEANKCWVQAISWLTLALLVATIVAASVAIFPRTKGPQGSLIFFGGVASRTTACFHEDILKCTEDEYRNDLIEQIHINANIAATKYAWIRRSMVALLLSLVPWSISVANLY